jgi:hypothetical protein
MFHKFAMTSFSGLRMGAGSMERLSEVEVHFKAQNSDRSVVLAAKRPVITAIRDPARLREHTPPITHEFESITQMMKFGGISLMIKDGERLITRRGSREDAVRFPSLSG